MAPSVLAIEDSQFVTLVSKAALLAEQLQSGLYEASDEVEIFPNLVDTIRMKHPLWSTQLKKYGTPGQSLVAPLLQAAAKRLKEEEVRLKKLHSSCYMKCFASSSFKFPKELFLSFERMIDVFENLPLLMREGEEVTVRDIMITSSTGTNDRQQQHYDNSIPDPVKGTDYQDPLADPEMEYKTPSKSWKQRSLTRLPFYADKRYVPMSSSVLEVRGYLEGKNGPQVVVLQGGPGTGKSSLARHLALHYQDKQVYYPGNMQHFANGVFYLSCGGGVDIKAKQLELLHILDYPLHLLLTSGECQQLSEGGIHKKLVEYMQEKEALIFLDDVEDYDLLHHLVVPNSRIKYLLTSELELQWENSANFTMPPLRIEDARKILTQQIDLPEFIPAHLQDVADAIIIATGANPLALVSLSLAVNSGPGSAADIKEWLEVERKFRRLLDDDEEGLIVALGEQYPRHVACSMALAIDYLPHEVKLILFALAAFDDLPIPEVVVKLLVQCTTGNISNFSGWKDYLVSRGLIQQQQNIVPWSREPQSTLTIHGIRKHCIKVIKEVEISMLIDSLLGRLGESLDELSSDAALMTALCVVYGEGELAIQAAAKLNVSNFSHMGSLILTWLAPFVSLLTITEEDPYPEQPPIVHVLARQVILEFISNRNPENGITGLLAISESALTTCWALAVHALDRPLLIASDGILKGLVTLLGKHIPYETQKYAAWALTNIAISDDRQFNLTIFPGFLKGFVHLLSTESQPEIQTVAAWTLMVVAEAEENRLDIVSFPGALSGLVALLERNIKPEIQINAAWALANLTGDRDNKITVAEFPGALQGLVGLLAKDVSPVAQSKAAWALANMAEAEENKLTIAAFPGALEGLVRLLSVDDFQTDLPRDQLYSTRALANLNAAWALANLSDAKVSKESIAVFPGALEGLVKLLNKDVNPQTRCSAAWTLVHLAESTETTVKVIIAQIPGAVEGLVSLFEIESEHNPREMQQQATWAWRNLSAAWALGSLADAEENRTKVANCTGVLRGLVGLLGNPKHGSLHLQSRAAWAVANIAASPANQELIASFPGALGGLVGLLQKDVNPYTQSNALRAVAHIVEAKSNRVLLGKFPGALENLVGLLSPEVSSYTQNNAARALATMATAGENQISIAKFPGALEGFVRLLGKDESPAVQTNAAWALANLAEESMNKLGIALFPEAIERLLRLLEKDIDPSVQAVAARTLTQIDARTNNRLILSSAEAYRSRAVINIEMENYKQALTDLDRAHTLQPENPYTFSWRRFVRVMLKEYAGSLQDANKAIELQPHKQFHWQERGILKGMMGDLEGALEDLTRGLQLNPDDYESLKHRGYIKYLMEDLQGACDDAEKALENKPSQLDDPAYGAGFLGGLSVEFLGYKLK
ncbi:hypothetical protein R1flu_004620 [Riccia fluitans]|uniref:Protein unc-45 homolog B n=1 Tax=Riccia fluitans TaxID=41844 RepID=A0ABD1YRD4_9MARC